MQCPDYNEQSDGRFVYRRPRRALPKRLEGVASLVVRFQTTTQLSVAKADAIIPAPMLLKKLGSSAFRLWSALLMIRDPECYAHPSAPGMARAAGLSLVQVEKSLIKLRKFKLISDLGFMYRKVPCNCDPELGYHEHKIFMRKVRGVLRSNDDNSAQSALVPRETAEMVKQAASHGGVRAGAGRRKGTLNSSCSGVAETKQKESSGGAYRNQEPISYEEPNGSSKKCAVSPRVSFSSTKSAGVRSGKGALRHHCPISIGCSYPSIPSEEASMSNFTWPEKRSFAPALQRYAPAAPSACDAHDAPANTGDGAGFFVDGKEVSSLEELFSVGKGAREIGFGGGGSARAQRFTPDDVRATTELVGKIAHPRVPPPPRVQETDSEEERLRLLKVAYRAAHSKTLRTDYWRPAKAMTAKERAALLEAAQALVAEGISPTAWARFSFHQWLQMGKKTAPLAKWVWSAARIHEHAGWCIEAVGTLASATAAPLPASRELLQRFGQMQRDLGWGRPTDVVVSEIMSSEELGVLMAQQTAQLDAWNKDIKQRIRDGEWVWG